MRPPRALAATVTGLAAAATLLAAPAAAPAAEDARHARIEGRFGGDAALEGGCAWLDTPDGRFEVLWPHGWHVEYEPLRLIDPAGRTYAIDGDHLTVTGDRAEHVMTICQVGPAFDADAVSD